MLTIFFSGVNRRFENKFDALGKIFLTDTHEAAAKKIRDLAQAGDVILFKASHGMHLEKVIELI